MNNPHKNARTTPLGRAEMIRRIEEDGRPVAEVAAGFGVSERTARKWLSRWRTDGRAGLENRSSRPHASRSPMHGFWAQLTARLRRDYRLTGEEIASRLGLARSTVAGWLTRMGLGGGREGAGAALSRERPGELLHLDIKSSPVSRASATASPATGGQARAWAMTSCMSPSMMRPWPMSRFCPTNALVDHRLPHSGTALVQRKGRPCGAGDDRQRLGLHRSSSARSCGQRQGGALHPDHAEWAMPSRSPRHTDAPSICLDGSPGTISTGPMLASPDDHRLKPSPEQPDQNPQLEGR